MKFINENMYIHGRAKISDLLNKLLHEFLGLIPAINLTNLFCKLNIFLLLDELATPKNYPTLHSRVIIGKIN
jgi:hypothetical protein